ncbi:MAG: hypothetical protein LBD52_04430 [Prevotellaceae bacterium]|jgi:hypothetical protein|nr:hypothetical protein [Prevotellaceae bacterium]
MKNKWELLYNPFTKIAGWKAFAIGTVIVCATVLAGYYNHACFTGLQMKMVSYHLSLNMCFLIQATGLLSMIILMYLVSLCFVKRVRLLDIAGTVLLSRAPYLFIALLVFCFNPMLQSIMDNLQENKFSVEALTGMLTPFVYFILLLFAVLVVLLLVWYIALLYHAFKVSTGIKGRKTGVLLTGIIILSETITFVLLIPCFKVINNI